MRILVSGSGGLIGSSLVPSLVASGHEVLKLVRRKPVDINEIEWDAGKGLLDLDRLEGLDALIHLAGENIGDGRWTNMKKDRILQSRVKSTKFLSENLAQLKRPPKVFITASAVGYYGDRGDEALTEDSPAGEGFLAETCKRWEEASQGAAKAGIRVVNTRFGVVLSAEAKLIKIQKRIFTCYLGGVIGSGKQYLSWISLEDLKNAILFILNHSEITGPVNVVSPNPVANREYTRIFARVLKRPAFFRIPGFVIQILYGEKGKEMILSSTRAIPQKLLNAGFGYKYSDLNETLNTILIIDD